MSLTLKPTRHFLLPGCLLLAACLFRLLSFPPPASTQSSSMSQALASRFAHYEVVRLDAASIAKQVRETGRLQLASGDVAFELDLTLHDLRAANYQAEDVGADGTPHRIEPRPVRTFKGKVHGIEGSQARFTIDGNNLEGIILTPKEQYYVEPLKRYSSSANAQEYVLYKESDVIKPAEDINDAASSCGVTLLEKVNGAAKHIKAQRSLNSQHPAVVPTIPPLRGSLMLATEADFEYVSAFGGAGAADAEILNILNQVDGIYETQLGINIKVVYQNTWSSTASPYPYTSTDPEMLLQQFTNYWNTNKGGVVRNVAHLWTGKTLGSSIIGLANQSVACSSPLFAYGLSARISGNQSIYVTAHEIGHNIGASHPEDQNPPIIACNSTIMSGIGGASASLNFCQFSLDQINSYLDANAACLSVGDIQPPPTAGPANNNFANAQVLTGNFNSVTGSNILANKELGEPNHASGLNGQGGASVWYKWTAPSSGIIHFDTFRSSFSTAIGVYTGASVNTLMMVAVSQTAEYVEFNAVAGTIYSIAVDGINGDTGSITLARGVGTYSNDNFVNARFIRGNSGNVNVNGTNATIEPGESGAPCPTVWYSWIAPSYGKVVFRPLDPPHYAILSVYTGDQLTNLSIIARSAPNQYTDPNDSIDNNSYTFNAIPGTTYRIRVAPCSSFLFSLSWSYENGPSNDNFANALVLSGSFGSVVGSDRNASIELGEPVHGNLTIWYRWTAPFSGIATFDTRGSRNQYLGSSIAFGKFETTRLDIYTGTSLNSLSPISSGNDSVTFNAVANTTYQIQVSLSFDSYYAADFIPLHWGAGSCTNDNFANARVFSGNQYLDFGDNLGATKEPGEPNHAGNPGGKSIWFRWTAPVTAQVAIEDGGGSPSLFSTITPVIGVYTGSSVNALSEAPGTQRSLGTLRFPAVAGTTYSIALDGSNGATGTYYFSFTQTNIHPANDFFATAQAISGNSGSITGDNLAASKEGGEPNHAGNQGGTSVWYNWPAPTTGTFTFSTAGSNFNTLLAVYTGTSVNALTEVVSNDDAGGSLQSRVMFNAIAGTTYRVAVDGQQYDRPYAFTGNLVLSWDNSTPPANDNFAGAQILSGSNGSTTGRNSVASKEGGEPNHAGNQGGTSVWYNWPAPTTGTFTFSTAGSNFNTLLAVYTGTSVNALTEVVSNDDYSDTSQSLVTFNAVAGTTYRIAVDGSIGVPGKITPLTGNINLSWIASGAGTNSNDNFANALPIVGSFGGIIGNNVGASKEPGEPNHAGDRGGRSIWYRWSAPFTGPVRFTTNGSNFDTLLAAYTGASVNNLTSVPNGSNDDDNSPDNFDSGLLTSSMTFNAVTGTTYYLAVDGSEGRAGNVTLRWGPDVSLSGSVFFNAGLCGINNNVTIVLNGDSSKAIRFTGSNNFTFQHLRGGGNYSVRAISDAGTGCVIFFLARVFNYTPLLGNAGDAIYTDDGQRGGSGAGSVGGYIRNPVGASLSNVAVQLSGMTQTGSNVSSLVYSVTNGSYTLPQVSQGSYTITASSPQYAFAPLSYPYDGTGNQLSFNFTAQLTYTISGQTRDGTGVPINGVTMTLNNGIQSQQTDANGYYSFTVPASSNYTVTASKAGVTFSQPTLTFNNLAANQHNADFTMTPAALSISGRVSVGANGLNGVTMMLSGSQTSAVITDSNGNYAFPPIPAGGDYTVTPSLTNYNFTPPNQSFTNLSANQTANFTAASSSLNIDTESPRAGRVSGGQQLTLTGSFTGLASVQIGGVTATINSSSANQLIVTTPAHTAGAVQIALIPTSGSTYTKPNAFAYLPTTFTDNVLTVGVTSAKAQHITELRQAVDALRAVAGLQPASWTDLVLLGVPVKAVHITELRARLEEAVSVLGGLGLPSPAYTDTSLAGVPIKRIHIEELRQRIRNIAGT